MNRERVSDGTGRETGRRLFVKGLGVATGATLLPAGTAVGAQQDDDDGGDDDDAFRAPASRPALGDLNDDGTFQNVMHFDGDPAVEFCESVEESDRERVVHVTSNGEETSDYAASIVNVSEQELTVGDVVGDGVELTYDYFQGPENANAAPDEVFAIVEATEAEVESAAGDDQNNETANGTGSQAQTDGTGQEYVTIAFQTTNDGIDPSENLSCEDEGWGWQTRDVAAEMGGQGSGWRDTTVPVDRIESGELLLPIGIALRDAEPFGSLQDEYGADRRLLAVGFGKGRTMQETVVDVYYDDLVVGEETYEFPPALPVDLDVAQTGPGAMQLTLSFTRDEQGVELADVDRDSVGLWPFTTENDLFSVVSVPPTHDFARVRGVTVRDVDGEERLQAVIPSNEFRDLLDEGEQRVIVAGEFEDVAEDDGADGGDDEEDDNVDRAAFIGVDTVTIDL